MELAEHAAANNASAVAIVPPYYYSDHSEYEIVAHYKAVAKAVPLPIFDRSQGSIAAAQAEIDRAESEAELGEGAEFIATGGLANSIAPYCETIE